MATHFVGPGSAAEPVMPYGTQPVRDIDPFTGRPPGHGPAPLTYEQTLHCAYGLRLSHPRIAAGWSGVIGRLSVYRQRIAAIAGVRAAADAASTTLRLGPTPPKAFAESLEDGTRDEHHRQVYLYAHTACELLQRLLEGAPPEDETTSMPGEDSRADWDTGVHPPEFPHEAVPELFATHGLDVPARLAAALKRLGDVAHATACFWEVTGPGGEDTDERGMEAGEAEAVMRDLEPALTAFGDAVVHACGHELRERLVPDCRPSAG